MSEVSTQGRRAVGVEGTSASRTGLVVATTAAGANLVLWGLGRLVGVEFVVLPRGSAPAEAQTISAGLVLASTVVPVLLGSVLLAATRGSSRRWWPRLAATGLVIGVVTVALPLGATAPAGTKWLLAAMHVVTGVTWFVQVRRALTQGRH